ncbi:MAG: FG-GAP-like repeat-containing protein, partial [Acidobacteriota bacterium]|nr:FG-GAP-like repeat-containing protein [Acidobacteriota bacterium]
MRGPLRLAAAHLLYIGTVTFAMADPPTDTPADWWSQARQQIRDSEYHVSLQERQGGPAALQAPNRAQDFRTYFSHDGIRVIPRREAEPSWEWGLTLRRYGREGTLVEIDSAQPSAELNRVTYERGPLSEWYVNDRSGLEQGFTIPNAPKHAVGPLVLDLALQGSLSPFTTADGQAIDFKTGAGVHVLRFAQLRAWDAHGRALDTSMTAFRDDGRSWIRLILDDTDAVYPVTIDPIVTSLPWNVTSDQALAELGSVVATAGDVNADGFSDIVVAAEWFDAAEENEGRIFVYHGSPSGPSLQADWMTDGGQAYAGRELDVATAGDVNGDGFSDLIVGLPFYNPTGSTNGRVEVYHGSASGLGATPAWSIEDTLNAALGYSVSSAGDVNGDLYADVIIGAPLTSAPENREGRAYVYLGGSSGLAATPVWSIDSNDADTQLGYSVSLAGDVNGDGYGDVVVGGPHLEDLSGEGRAYLFPGSSTGIGSLIWTDIGDSPGARFGWSVSTAGDVNCDGYADVIVGAPWEDGHDTESGVASVYLGSSTGLANSWAWRGYGESLQARYGEAVSTAGDLDGDGCAEVVIGASLHSFDDVTPDEGLVEIYNGSPTGLPSTATHTFWSSHGGALLGESVGIAGDVNGDGFSDVILGAPGWDDGEPFEGRAFVFYGSASPPAATAALTVDVLQLPSEVGKAVASAGDVNGDGYSDIVIGTPAWDTGVPNAGRVFVFYGAGPGPNLTPWTADGVQENGRLGESVGAAGDVDGDGYGDLIVGVPRYNLSGERGAFIIYHGSDTGLPGFPSQVVVGENVGDRFGHAVGGAGDVNGDGYADVVATAHWYDNGENFEGAAYVFHGSPTGLTTPHAWRAEIDQQDAQFGESAGTAGDVNGDGYSDVIVGSQLYDDLQVNEGAVFVYHGSPTGLSPTHDWMEQSSASTGFMGRSAGTAGDVNGDGYSDVIVSCPGCVAGGWAGVYHGSPTGLSTFANWGSAASGPNSHHGESVASAGDINNDGYSDVIIGDSTYDLPDANANSAEGAAFVYYGSSAGLSLTPAWTAVGGETLDTFGTAVASAGDVNGDGWGDLVIGIPGGGTRGQWTLFYGNDGPNEHALPQQWRADGYGVVQPQGRSDDDDAIRLLLNGRPPFGPGSIRTE